MPAILIADDEELIRKMVSKSLIRLGYEVIEAENGLEVLDMLKEKSIDLIIMDLIMPEKGGIETLIETHKLYPAVKLIAISGKVETSNDSIKGIADQFGVDAVFAKPFEIFDLLKKIKQLVPPPSAGT